MSDERAKTVVRRPGWRKWGTIALLGYLRSWLLLWSLAKADVLPHNDTLGVIFYVVYLPLILFGESVLRVRVHI
jgi:hypothetical protein